MNTGRRAVSSARTSSSSPISAGGTSVEDDGSGPVAGASVDGPVKAVAGLVDAVAGDPGGAVTDRPVAVVRRCVVWAVRVAGSRSGQGVDWTSSGRFRTTVRRSPTAT